MTDKIKIPFEWLRENNACSEAVEWLRTQPDMQTAWDTCQRPDWMLWLLDEVAIDPMIVLHLQVKMMDTPIDDGRTVEDLLTDNRSIEFVAMKRRRLAGEIINLDMWAAAWAAAGAAAWAAARAAAWAAAWAAAGAAAGAAAWAAAGAAARDAAWAWQANAIREIIPVVPMPKLDK